MTHFRKTIRLCKREISQGLVAVLFSGVVLCEAGALAQNPAAGTPTQGTSTQGTSVEAAKPLSDVPPAVLEEAAQIYKLGQEAYEKGRYESAFTSFHQAYQMTKSPDLLYNLAKVAVKLNQTEVAIGYYRQYLAKHPADEATVQKELDALLVSSPISAPIARPVESDSEPNIPRWVPWTMIGGGVGFLGISLGLLVAGGISPADTPADQTQRRGLLASGGVLCGIGVAATVGGVVLKMRQKKQNVPPSTARLFLSPNGLGLQLVGNY